MPFCIEKYPRPGAAFSSFLVSTMLFVSAESRPFFSASLSFPAATLDVSATILAVALPLDFGMVFGLIPEDFDEVVDRSTEGLEGRRSLLPIFLSLEVVRDFRKKSKKRVELAVGLLTTTVEI